MINNLQIFPRRFESRAPRSYEIVFYERESRTFLAYRVTLRWFTWRKWCTSYVVSKRKKLFFVLFTFIIYNQLINYRWWKMSNGVARWNTLVWSRSWTTCRRLSWCYTRILPKTRAARNVSMSSYISVLALTAVYKRICHLGPDSGRIRATRAVTIW